ncbi:hypothetical protein AAFF_G00220270 [Aldrovandia affinis]|uniref:Uncharacterized protein n=1 Tax=Aldrovandia affinis TaxID=143900 RepID=A0AAD7RG21_9TELE|nr:hypothetical protein AAFF_G00220270 [Aldrovandia affinis]
MDVCVVCSKVDADAGKSLGFARLGYHHAVTAPPQSEICVMARVPSGFHQQGDCCLVKPLDLNGSVGVAQSVGRIQRGRIPIRVRNVNPSVPAQVPTAGSSDKD